MDENNPGPEPRMRLGEHENWLPLPLVQAVLDILYERNRAQLSALLGEAATGEPPKSSRQRPAQ